MDYSTLTNEQKAAVTHGDGNIIVSASAGSGKTHVIITRIIRLITELGVSVNEILAVTFTNLAASEMKEKLKNAIINQINETGDERLKKELEEVSSSDISTVHSFCLNLLKKYFYVLELDATFGVCDDSKSKRLKAQAMDNVFERLYEEENQIFLRAVETFSRGRNDNGLRKAVSDFAAFVESEENLDEFCNKLNKTYANASDIIDEIFIDYYGKRFKNLLIKVEKIKPSFYGVEKRTKQIDEFIKVLNAALNATTLKALYNAVNVPKIDKAPAKDDESKILKGYHDVFDDLVKQIISCLPNGGDNVLDGVDDSYDNLQSLIFTYKNYYDEFSKLKREENVVDFSDLEHFTLKLLRNNEVLNEVKGKYKYVFIDEYQDVNEVQEKIISLICNDNGFMVGDSKQSIYAFRGCNPAHFINKNESYKRGSGTSVSLDRNFRSAESIINVVNNVFSRVMTYEFGSHAYKNNKMVFGGDYKNYKGKAVYDVIVQDVEKEEKKAVSGVYSVINDVGVKKEDSGSEEKLVLKLINDAIGKDYYDVKEKKYKKLTYGDIVILIRSISGLGESVITTLINNGVPVSAETKNSIGDYPEIKSLVNFIKLITCARQDVPLANTLLEFFNFDEEELAVIRERGDKYSDFFDCAVFVRDNYQDEIALKLKNFFAYLDKIRIISEFATAAEVLNRIIFDTGYDAKITASGLGDVKMRRIERFIAASSEGGTSLSVYEFSTNLEEILKDVTVSEAAGDNTVKIMTMHASKGLEFPYVIICGARKAFNMTDAAGFYLKDRKYGLVTKTLNRKEKTVSKNALHTAFGKKITEQSVIEEIRIFYVALTRAKCELHVITDESLFDADKPYVGDIKKYCDLLDESDAEIVTHKESDLSICGEIDGVKVAGKEVDAKLTELIKRNIDLTYKYDNDTLLPVKSSVSEINSANAEEEYYKTASIYGESDAEKGTAYHKALELIDFYGDLDNQMRVLIKNDAFTSRELSLIDVEKIRNILEIDVFSLIKDYTLYKEQKFCQFVTPSEVGYNYDNAQILVQGVVDLIAVKDGEAILIDYKLSKIVNEKDLIEKYEKQMRLYKSAIENCLKLTVKSVYLVNILQEKSIKINL